MNIDLDELERKAKAAGKYECGFSWPDESEWLELFDHCHKHGRFISALNPSVAQELINRLRDAEEQAASLLKLVTDLRFALGDDGKRMQPELVEYARGLAKDAARLDWLDKQNEKMNLRSGSNYGWKFDVNHNRVALTDCNWPKHSAREAIDAAMAKEQL